MLGGDGSLESKILSKGKSPLRNLHLTPGLFCSLCFLAAIKRATFLYPTLSTMMLSPISG
jgi:hypothetical protein